MEQFKKISVHHKVTNIHSYFISIRKMCNVFDFGDKKSSLIIFIINGYSFFNFKDVLDLFNYSTHQNDLMDTFLELKNLNDNYCVVLKDVIHTYTSTTMFIRMDKDIFINLEEYFLTEHGLMYVMNHSNDKKIYDIKECIHSQLIPNIEKYDNTQEKLLNSFCSIHEFKEENNFTININDYFGMLSDGLMNNNTIVMNKEILEFIGFVEFDVKQTYEDWHNGEYFTDFIEILDSYEIGYRIIDMNSSEIYLHECILKEIKYNKETFTSNSRKWIIMGYYDFKELILVVKNSHSENTKKYIREFEKLCHEYFRYLIKYFNNAERIKEKQEQQEQQELQIFNAKRQLMNEKKHETTIIEYIKKPSFFNSKITIKLINTSMYLIAYLIKQLL